MGNPSKYAVWLDEGFNLEIRRVSEKLHAANFERRLLCQLNAPAVAPKRRRT